MTHPKGAGFGFPRSQPDQRLTRGEKKGEEGSPFALPLLDDPVHLHHRMDCPRCLDAERRVRGTVEVTMAIHLHVVEGCPALGLTIAPRITRTGPDLHCTAGCALTDEEWEVVLGAAFLDACRGYAARMPRKAPPLVKRRSPR